jgi:TatD DNase family protein
MGLADVHAHLTHPKVDNHVDELVARARAADVTTVITAGLNASDNLAARELTRRFPNTIKAAFGFYPVEAVRAELPDVRGEYPSHRPEESCESNLLWLREHAREAFAIGEIGLDGHWVPEQLWPKQDAVFRQLIEIALQANKVIIVHSRKRERRAFEIVAELGVKRVLWHCFGGKLKLAEKMSERGHFFSIPSNARRAEGFTRMLKGLARDRLLFETDCPYLGVNRDRESEPADVAQTAVLAAELWKVSLAEVKRQVTENFRALFGVDP